MLRDARLARPSRPARPIVLAIACLAAATSAGGCSSESPPDPPAPAPDTRPPTPAEWDRPVTRTDEASASAARGACKFARGSLADESLGKEIPTGKDIPIETIVVLMQENRSFDHYFGHFGKYAGRNDVAVPPSEDVTNPSRTGPASSGTHKWQRAAHHCFLDTAHGWNSTHKQVNGGKMDGFYETNHDIKGEVMPDPTMALRDGERAMWWYDEQELPYYYALAKAFGIGDHYFASVAGPTWPNRMYLFAATSFGRASNEFANIDAYPFPQNDAVVLDELEKRHVDWKLYTSGIAGAAVVLGVQLPVRYSREVVLPIDDFYADAAAGKLPPVVFLDPNFAKTGDPEGDDEHPPAHLQIGQAYVAKIVDALMKSPQWGKLALFVTYDEHGGLYDHLPPPKACPPDDKPPLGENDVRLEGAFDTLGVRVPFLVVSPYAKRGHVSHGVYDHTSITRFIQAKHRLPALTARDANALVPTDFFDFQRPPDLSIPALPPATVNEGERSYCNQTFSR